MKDLANTSRELPGFFDRDARRKINIHPHRSFIEFRQKLAAKTGQRHDAGAQDQNRECNNDGFVIQSPYQSGPIDPFAGSDNEVFFFGYAFPQKEIAKQRYQRQ